MFLCCMVPEGPSCNRSEDVLNIVKSSFGVHQNTKNHQFSGLPKERTLASSPTAEVLVTLNPSYSLDPKP